MTREGKLTRIQNDIISEPRIVMVIHDPSAFVKHGRCCGNFLNGRKSASISVMHELFVSQHGRLNRGVNKIGIAGSVPCSVIGALVQSYVTTNRVE